MVVSGIIYQISKLYLHRSDFNDYMNIVLSFILSTFLLQWNPHVKLLKTKNVFYPLFIAINDMLVARHIATSMTDYGVQQKLMNQDDIQEKRTGDIVMKWNVRLRKQPVEKIYYSSRNYILISHAPKMNILSLKFKCILYLNSSMFPSSFEST